VNAILIPFDLYAAVLDSGRKRMAYHAADIALKPAVLSPISQVISCMESSKRHETLKQSRHTPLPAQ
jgi:hypothetical protein